MTPGRVAVNYLRLSITDRCNQQCFYCHPQQGWEKLPAREILRYEEFLHLVRVAVGAGIRKVRVTGGEPLVRRGVVDFLARLKEIPGLEEIALTTNGSRLAEMAGDLFAAGLRHLNISLDSLNPERYRRITGSDTFHEVLGGIRQALELGFRPLKINCVVLRGVNDAEILDFALLAREHPLEVRFIEFMPMVDQGLWAAHFLPIQEVQSRLEALGLLEPLPTRPTDGPARIFRPQGFAGTLGLISSVSRHHCPRCNRLRLTAAGGLRPCLFSREEIDLKGPLRRGASETLLKGLFLQAMERKSRQPPPALRQARTFSFPMVSIGG